MVGLMMMFMNFSRLDIRTGRGDRGNIRRTSTTSAMHIILVMMLSGLLFLYDRQMAIAADSSSSDVTGTSMTECMNGSLVWFLSARWGTRGSWGTRDVAISTTTVAYGGIGIMVLAGVFIDTLSVLAFSSGVTRWRAYVSCTSFTGMSELIADHWKFTSTGGRKVVGTFSSRNGFARCRADVSSASTTRADETFTTTRLGARHGCL
jgi:hypothetical protein